jgi:hypothetical protein
MSFAIDEIAPHANRLSVRDFALPSMAHSFVRK